MAEKLNINYEILLVNILFWHDKKDKYALNKHLALLKKWMVEDGYFKASSKVRNTSNIETVFDR